MPVAFVESRPFTLGVELEVQLVNTRDYDLTKAASVARLCGSSMIFRVGTCVGFPAQCASLTPRSGDETNG
ncbi:hypothetical protein [Burkholderia ubonensis]|uniref:hypothetical protein n=1 Tax=Burkholderia ubonensis TaxID=101571 RepID=UPI000754C4AE|nr:hypothetical protein [Burkholderia ubonensis]KWN80132.1 hypothetical protein WM23_22240 [Burkholderia ubonensis]